MLSGPVAGVFLETADVERPVNFPRLLLSTQAFGDGEAATISKGPANRSYGFQDRSPVLFP